jgi:acetyl esterase/lipase
LDFPCRTKNGADKRAFDLILIFEQKPAPKDKQKKKPGATIYYLHGGGRARTSHENRRK